MAYGNENTICPDGSYRDSNERCPGDQGYQDQGGTPTPSTPSTPPSHSCPGGSWIYPISHPEGICSTDIPDEADPGGPESDRRNSTFNGTNFANLFGNAPRSNYNFNFGDAPGFTARRFRFDPASIYDDPSVKFRFEQGRQALENSAAGRGIARHGNTAKGLIDYGQAAASQEYGNAFERAYKIFQSDYQGDLDEYKPRLIGWQTNAAGRMRQQELESADRWREFLANLNFNQFLLGQAA